MVTYEIRQLHTPDDRTVWAVVAFVDGRPLGADHHWLRPVDAVRAKQAYEAGRATHGGPPDEALA